MSKYFQTLNRLSQQSKTTVSTRPDEQESKISVDSSPLIENETLLHVPPFSDLPLAKRQRAYGLLLDSIRSIATASSAPCVVLAGVSHSGVVSQITRSLDLQAQDQGLNMVALEIRVEGSRRFLQRVSTDSAETTSISTGSRYGLEESESQFELAARSSSGKVDEWLSNLGVDFEVAVIQAPPLSENVEAALLARNCDGLILAVENLKDSQATVAAAIGKAKDAGCPVLGVILFGSRQWLPRWLRRIVLGAST